MIQRNRLLNRYPKGTSLAEMLIATLLLGLTLAAIGEVMVVTTLSSNKLNNRASTTIESRNAVNRIMKDVREASNIGDSYDNLQEDNLYNSEYFPATTNPLYTAATGPQFSSTLWTWSGWPTNWPVPPYKLDGQTLIVQQPMYFTDPTNDPLSPTYSSSLPQNPLNGLPIILKEDSISAGVPSNNLDNMDTVVYRLIADPDEPNEYILQRARFVGMDSVTGMPTSSFRTMINPPQTILTGIIGPLPISGGSDPEIFSYYTAASLNAPKTETSDPSSYEYIRGVGIDIELQKPSTSTGNPAYQQGLGIHTEAFLKHGSFMSPRN